MRMRKPVIMAAAIGALLLGYRMPAYAIGVPTTIPASALGYKVCMDLAVTKKEKLACALMVLDPPADRIAFVGLSLTFDPEKVSLSRPVYFGDFSQSGEQLPLQYATIGGVQSLAEDPGLDRTEILQPRTGTLAEFFVDNTVGTAQLVYDLSANPTPPGSLAQNFFGYQIFSKKGSIAGIEYFDVPGDYDVTVASWSCTDIDMNPCGSDHPVYGYNISTTPEPSTWILLVTGFMAMWPIVGKRGRTRHNVIGA